MAIPGCGRGHDVRYLAARGYDAVGFDFSTAAIDEARGLARDAPGSARFERRDIFSLPRDYRGAFDGVWEYTCFCAIEPGRRREYVDAVEAIVKPGGWLLACFYPIRAGGGGPPFSVSIAEVRQLFARSFRIDREWEPTSSVPRRRGEEWMVLARKAQPRDAG